jgi:hypothetical protein
MNGRSVNKIIVQFEVVMAEKSLAILWSRWQVNSDGAVQGASALAPLHPRVSRCLPGGAGFSVLAVILSVVARSAKINVLVNSLQT